jgi:hypothetical protein
MDELIKEILTHVDDEGSLGELAKELQNIIKDHKAGEISDQDLNDLLIETLQVYKAHDTAHNEVVVRWAVKIAQIAAKAMI